jgi:hypothetical protein
MAIPFKDQQQSSPNSLQNNNYTSYQGVNDGSLHSYLEGKMSDMIKLSQLSS